MKKWMYVCAAAVMAVSLLSGCGGRSDGSSAQTTAGQTQAKAETEKADNGAETADRQETVGSDRTGAGTADKQETEPADKQETGAQASDDSGSVWLSSDDLKAAAGKHHVKIQVKDYGTITVELDGDHAPVTVANFLKLSREGFYNGLTFHRIMSGFMIQGGDPLGTGMGGSDHEIKGEFKSNGVDNPLSHTRGAISMARSQAKDSASSQFFIVHEDSTFLDGDYACFGYVTDGMDVVDAVCQKVKPVDNNGTVPKADQPVIESIEVTD